MKSARRVPVNAHWHPIAWVWLLAVAAMAPALAQRAPEPMRFTLQVPCEGCEPYLLAEGAIVGDTPERFRDALQVVQMRGQQPRIQFNSRGGNLQSGMRLGRMIREAGLDTYIGGPYLELSRPGEPARVLAPRPVCYSACAYAFLGGVSRSVAEGGSYGLHQFYGAEGDVGDSRTQVMMAELAAYLDEMGVERRFLDLAATTAPETITRLSPGTARQLNVDNQEPPRGAWRIAATDQGQVVASVTQQAAGRDALVVMELRREDRRLVGSLRYRIRQGWLSEEELAEEFTVRGVPELRFRDVNAAPGTPALTVVADGWAREEGGWFVAGFIADPALTELLASAVEVEFSALPGSRFPAVAPRARLSTGGFTGALKALER
jgi:hypothetical protein